jgi:hypothetical protein
VVVEPFNIAEAALVQTVPLYSKPNRRVKQPGGIYRRREKRHPTQYGVELNFRDRSIPGGTTEFSGRGILRSVCCVEQ